MAGVQVAGEQHVDAAAGERRHREVGAADPLVGVPAGGEVERVMGDDDLDDLVGQRRQRRAQTLQLLEVDAAVLDDERARGVDADDRELGVDEGRLQVGADVALVVGERPQHAREDVVERHVVVARHDDLRCRQAREEVARRGEQLAARALRQVAGDDDDVGADPLHRRDQRVEQRRVDAAEVQVRQVDEGAHRRQPAGAGTATRSPRGWMRCSSGTASRVTLAVGRDPQVAVTGVDAQGRRQDDAEVARLADAAEERPHREGDEPAPAGALGDVHGEHAALHRLPPAELQAVGDIGVVADEDERRPQRQHAAVDRERHRQERIAAQRRDERAGAAGHLPWPK